MSRRRFRLTPAERQANKRDAEEYYREKHGLMPPWWIMNHPDSMAEHEGRYVLPPEHKKEIDKIWNYG